MKYLAKKAKKYLHDYVVITDDSQIEECRNAMGWTEANSTLYTESQMKDGVLLSEWAAYESSDEFIDRNPPPQEEQPSSPTIVDSFYGGVI